MKVRLYAGTINFHPSDDEWRNVHIDVADRPIYDSQANLMVRPEYIGDIAAMPMFGENSLDEIVCHHVLEHLHPDQADLAMREAYRVLKPGGFYDVEVPDADRVARAWVAGDLELWEMAQWMLGEQLPTHEPSDSHRGLFTEETLRNRLFFVGFELEEPLPTGLAARFRARKPGGER